LFKIINIYDLLDDMKAMWLFLYLWFREDTWWWSFALYHWS